MPQTFEDVIELLLPELRRRGLFWDDYFAPGATYRENIYEAKGQAEPPSDHPAGKMIWRPKGDAGVLINGTEEHSNGYSHGHLDDEEEAIDPTSMQLG